MAEYCLTTIIKSGVGVLSQVDVCSSSSSCASNYEEGSTAYLSLSCDSEYEFDYLNIVSDLAVQSLSLSCGSLYVPFVMPSCDVTIEVYLKRKNVIIDFVIVNPDFGCVGLVFPYDTGCVNNSFSVEVVNTSGTASALASPISGYRVKDWKINDVSQDSNLNNLSWSLDVSYYEIEVEFEKEPDCTKSNLIVDIEGEGSVSYKSGEYCDYLTLTLVPIPSSGYSFYGWEYAQGNPNYVKDGNNLLVNMSEDRYVKAIFLEITDFQRDDFKLFYCSSGINKSNVINFDYEGDHSSNNPSDSSICHFRIKFYSDSDKLNNIYTAFSLSDNSRWYYKDEYGYIKEFPSGGLDFDSSNKEVVFNPDIIPNYLNKTQIRYGDFIDTNILDLPLICGVEYYLDIESYNINTGTYDFIKSEIFIFDCSLEERHLWDEDPDYGKWICSAQGGDDLKVSNLNMSLFPSISANVYGHFQIVWQDIDSERVSIYGAKWDSENDILYSSGQGFSDYEYINDYYKPVVLTDLFNNFFIASINKNSIKEYAYPLKSSSSSIEYPSDDFRVTCYPGLTENLSSDDSILIRVFEEDKNGSFVIDKDNVIAIVSKTDIRLDVCGVKGAYSVRLRDFYDSQWGNWIGIDQDLPSSSDISTDLSNKAYSIDSDRFVVPFVVDNNNGIKRICCQILTSYGITRTYCVDLLLNKVARSYAFKFYKDSNYENEVPYYNGYALLSGEKEGTIVYFKVIFNEDVNDELTFNVVQQGINNIFDKELNKINGKEFRGSFTIYKEDGVFNKDGKAFIEINFSDSSLYCNDLESDKYNISVNSKKEKYYKIVSPEEIYFENNKKINKAILNNESFKQYYNIDDSNFMFGNPNYYRGNK